MEQGMGAMDKWASKNSRTIERVQERRQEV